MQFDSHRPLHRFIQQVSHSSRRIRQYQTVQDRDPLVWQRVQQFAANRKLSRDTLYPAVSCEESERIFSGMFLYKAVVRSNQYFLNRVAAISIFLNREAGNLGNIGLLVGGGGIENYTISQNSL
jgi:hypothetical protein